MSREPEFLRQAIVPMEDLVPAVLHEAPRDTTLKIYAIESVFAGRELNSPDLQAAMEIPARIDERMMANLEEEAVGRELIRKYVSPASTADVFTLPSRAAKLVDELIGEDAMPRHPIDFILALRSFYCVAGAATGSWSLDTQKRQSDRVDDLGNAFCIELASRMRFMIHEPDNEGYFELSEVYDRLFGAIDQQVVPEIYSKMMAGVDTYFMHVQSRYRLAHRILEHIPTEGIAEEGTPSLEVYNRPLNTQTTDEINRSAADAIECIHLLKAYHVAPMIVPAEALELPWDIAVTPPLKFTGGEEIDEYDPGALADFFFLQPNPNRTEVQKRIERHPTNPERRSLSLAGESPDLRLRLHDNGQISYGYAVHNIPGDHAEEQFALHDAHPVFVRLRALMIAIAFDAVVPEEVVRERVGGSVPQQYQLLREQSPTGEVIPQIVLSRLRELRVQGISHKNRTPRNWEMPKHPVTGHTKRLPEGMRRRPEAEEEARKHYKKLGKEFTGLEEGWNFVKGYKRGNLPEDTQFRRALFRNRSHTRQLLGRLGLH